MKNKELREVIIFLAVVIGLSFLVFWGPIALLKVPTIGFAKGAVGPTWAIALFMIGGFVPSIAGIFLTAVFEGRKSVGSFMKRAFRVRIGFRNFTAILLTAVILVLCWISMNGFLGGSFDFSIWLSALPTLLPLLILGPLSEEYGWRGFALKRLLNVVSPNCASLIIGVIWSLWHLPLFYMVGTNQYENHLSFATFLIAVTSSSFIYTYFYIRSNSNLCTAVLFHWAYTFINDAVHGGVKGSGAFSSWEFIPALVIGLVFAFLLSSKKVPARKGLNFTA